MLFHTTKFCCKLSIFSIVSTTVISASVYVDIFVHCEIYCLETLYCVLQFLPGVVDRVNGVHHVRHKKSLYIPRILRHFLQKYIH